MILSDNLGQGSHLCLWTCREEQDLKYRQKMGLVMECPSLHRIAILDILLLIYWKLKSFF